MKGQPENKICSKCKLLKLSDKFHIKKASKDGLQSKCKECCGIYLKENRQELLNRMAKYYTTHREERVAKQADYYVKNTNKIKEYYRKNRKQRAEYIRNRRQTDEAFRLLNNIRSRFFKVLNGTQKSLTTLELTGMESGEALLKYLYQKSPRFKDVSLKDLHVDHIIPCSVFDLTIPEHQRACFHYTNLQLLTPKENLTKSDKLPLDFDLEYHLKRHFP